MIILLNLKILQTASHFFHKLLEPTISLHVTKLRIIICPNKKNMNSFSLYALSIYV